MIARMSKIRQYCCEDISLIENYEKAVNDSTQMWVCHHRNEITMNARRSTLKKRGMYYNRPASELIFLTNSEHSTLHGTEGNNPRYRDVDEAHIRKLYGNRKLKAKQVAAKLGISVNCLYNKMKQYGIPTRKSLNKSKKKPLKNASYR